MGQTRFTNQSILHIKRNITLDSEKVFNMFSQKDTILLS